MARRRHSILPSLAAMLLCVVGSPPTRADSALQAASRIDAARFIVLAVANDPVSAAARTGGTTRAYGGGNDYAVSDSARRALRDVAAQYRLQSAAAWPIALLHLQCGVFAIPEGATRDELLAQLQQDRRISLAEPLNTYTLQGAGADPYADAQAGNERMAISAAHRLSTGRGVRVALIDTGLDTNHPDLRGRIRAQRNFVDQDDLQFQRDRHGTAVAGVLAANAGNGQGIVGVAPDAQVLALKACWQVQQDRDEARCNSFTLAQALASAVDLKAQIINLSLTGPPDPLLAALALQAMRKGIVIVGPSAATPSFPGGLSQVLSVARSEDHNVSAGLLQAPGRDVLTLAPGGHYGFSSGSSISTAEISGVAALLLSRDARLDATRLHHLLDEASDSRDTTSGPNRSVNACQALARVVTGADCGALTAQAH
jgi:subtilisin family serine protease